MRRVNWKKAREVIERYPNAAAAWAFGSAKDGSVRPGGDLDVAVLFSEPPSLDECADLRADLQETLRFDDIDVVILNRAGPILAFEGVSGRRLFCREIEACATFVSLTARQYEDEMGFAAKGLQMRQQRRANAAGGIAES